MLRGVQILLSCILDQGYFDLRRYWPKVEGESKLKVAKNNLKSCLILTDDLFKDDSYIHSQKNWWLTEWHFNQYYINE